MEWFYSYLLLRIIQCQCTIYFDDFVFSFTLWSSCLCKKPWKTWTIIIHYYTFCLCCQEKNIFFAGFKITKLFNSNLIAKSVLYQRLFFNLFSGFIKFLIFNLFLSKVQNRVQFLFIGTIKDCQWQKHGTCFLIVDLIFSKCNKFTVEKTKNSVEKLLIWYKNFHRWLYLPWHFLLERLHKNTHNFQGFLFVKWTFICICKVYIVRKRVNKCVNMVKSYCMILFQSFLDNVTCIIVTIW